MCTASEARVFSRPNLPEPKNAIPRSNRPFGSFGDQQRQQEEWRVQMVGSVTAVLAAIMFILATGPAAAQPRPRDGAQRVPYRDCVDHDGELTQSYSREALAKAERLMPEDIRRNFSICLYSIESQLAFYSGRRAHAGRTRLLRDCTDGPLSYRYTAQQLRHTLRSEKEDLLTATGCGTVLRSQLAAYGS